MTYPSDARRPFQIVTGVIREALRYSGQSAVLVAGGGPEGALLETWLKDAHIPFEVPPSEIVERILPLLEDLGGGLRSTPSQAGDELFGQASELAGRAISSIRGLLLVGTSNKTGLLLSFRPSAHPILPLGDLYASQILELAGGCTVPPPLQGISPEELSDVDSALRAYFEDGLPPEEAFGSLEPPRGRQIRRMLEESRKKWHHIPLIPKLGEGTLGLDLDL
jgi:hypothetical protein